MSNCGGDNSINFFYKLIYLKIKFYSDHKVIEKCFNFVFVLSDESLSSTARRDGKNYYYLHQREGTGNQK